WAKLSAGLVERAELLETLLRDLYGPQSLVREGVIPAAVVAGSPGFLRPMVGGPEQEAPPEFYAADIGRGPDGRWCGLDDRSGARRARMPPADGRRSGAGSAARVLCGRYRPRARWPLVGARRPQRSPVRRGVCPAEPHGHREVAREHIPSHACASAGRLLRRLS